MFRQFTYEGDFKDDEMTGRGVYRLANGDVYEGGFLKGEMHGLGQYKYESGSSYYGEWSKSDKKGFGVEVLQNFYENDVAMYVGQFRYDAKEGVGVYFYPNGDRYKGQLIEERPHGVGFYTYAGR